ncbi:MAG: ribonuclease E/G, partial [Pseudomonadota bacterium]
MSKFMLIDAVHPEETRVALVSDGRVDDFDFEAAGKRQLRGNIYLAKVTRVEPSLQAAFVEYGGNRHGFLAFSEIHPDYYQLPQEDREALLREEAELAAAEEAEDDAEAAIDPADDEEVDEAEAEAEVAETDADEDEDDDEDDDSAAPRKQRRRVHPSRRYKIQEVIRRRQVMLIQVVKEERGNKGAALTTYLSLAGRYCVLMPNTPRGGGISRKISNSSDRTRLKNITRALEVPQGMGLIVRTAGAKRTKTDIKRDFEYLQRLWDTIREKTFNSHAPALINEEGGLVHRAMRDLYDKDIEEVLVQGADAYREAKDLARLLMPSQARKVKQWKDPAPLFVAKKVEDQLDSIFSPNVTLKSGGYLVINQTEALVAIDVNSGKATRGRNIEQTATNTNIEAAEEACRQMRLRDLAGLVVIDFIDMDENKNNRAVEKKLKECLKLDRARVQHGRISQFGLMEISRQRRRTGVLESSSAPCKSCNGTGRQRSIESAALQLLRTIEARASGGGLLSLSVEAPGDVALYLLNNKRDAFMAIEDEAGIAISISSSDDMLPGDFKIDATKDPNAKRKRRPKPLIEGDPDDEEFAARVAAEDSELEDDPDQAPSEDAPKRGRSRRRGRKSQGEAAVDAEADLADTNGEDAVANNDDDT